MAVNEIPRTPEEKRYGFVQQGTFGTAALDGSAAYELDCEHTEFNADVKKLDIIGGYGSRTKKDTNVILHDRYSQPVIPIKLAAKQNDIDFFTYAAIQNVAESSTAGIFAKRFTFHDSQPDLQSGSGCFLTIFECDPVASSSYKAKDCICQSLTYTWESGAPLMLDANMMGLGVPQGTSNPDPGSDWTRNAAEYFYHPDIDTVEISFGGATVDFHLDSFELVISHDLVPIGQDGYGAPQVVAMTNRQARFKIKAVKDSDWNSVYDNWRNNTVINLRIGSGSSVPGGADGDLDFAIRGKIDTAAKVHDAVLMGEFSGDVLNTDSGTAGLTITIANGQDRSW